MNIQQLQNTRQKVLVVDDDPALRELLTDYLGRVGFDVHTATDGRAGLHALAESHFDLILTDYHMPAMTGLEMAACIRRSDTITPIILITGDSSALDPEVVAQAGITRVLPKPLRFNELLNKCLIEK
ncbi:response regulator [Candidatus Methylomirabilis sp.]|uniref:Response regulator n=1 Tax=Candidatus Methylomirabilis tolerans TaxID=3123416 RepID=A0AAJ1AKL5_9BACT|nr:response regulator [Candidatus Methylomirabilis sp.]